MSYPILKWNPPSVVRAPPVPLEIWEGHKEELCQLYKIMKLDDLMLFMREKHNFSPSRHQYAVQLKRWDAHKYVKTKGDGSSPANDTTGSTYHTKLTPIAPPGPSSVSSPSTGSSFTMSPGSSTTTSISHPSTMSSSNSNTALKRNASHCQHSPSSYEPKRRKLNGQFDNTQVIGSSQRSDLRFHSVAKPSLPIAYRINRNGVKLEVPLKNRDPDSSDEESDDDSASDSDNEMTFPARHIVRSYQQINPTVQASLKAKQSFVKISMQTDLQNPFDTDDEDSSDALDDKHVPDLTPEIPAEAEKLFETPESDRLLGNDGFHDNFDAIDPFADDTAEISDMTEDDTRIHDIAQSTEKNDPWKIVTPGSQTSTLRTDGAHVPETSTPYNPPPAANVFRRRPALATDEYVFHASLQREISEWAQRMRNGDGPTLQISSYVLPDQIGYRTIPNAFKEQQRMLADMTDIPIPAKMSAVELLQYAQCGTNLDDFDKTHLSSIRQIADFLFGAKCFEDAFVINLLVYKCSNSCAEASPQQVTRDLINVARSSISRSQDEILRHLLSQALQTSQNTGEADRCRKFLLHSFLAATCRKQDDVSTSMFHRASALQEFDLNSYTGLLPNEWYPAGLVVYQQMNSLLQGEGALMGTETLAAKALCEGQGLEHGMKHINLLRSVLQWCKDTLDESIMDQGCWRNLQTKCEHNRTIETTAIFCHLWQQWQVQSLDSEQSNWGSRDDPIKHLGISYCECLSTVATMIVDAYSKSLDVVQRFDNEFYEGHLSIKAKEGLATILQQTNAELAYSFGRAFIAQPPGDTMLATSDASVWERLRRTYVRSFSAKNIELDLPHLEYDASLLPPDDPISPTAFQDTSQLFFGPPMNPSMHTASSGLASMRLLQERIRNNIFHTVDTLKVELPSAAMQNNPAVDFDLEKIMDLAERSFQSMSIGSEQLSHVVTEWESNFRTSLAPSLVNIVR